VQPDILARVLAVLGLLTSAGSLVWQFITHRLTGARVRCELRLALHNDHSPAGTLDWLAASRMDLRFLPDADRTEFPHEAALITVRNCGRTPVSVHFPVLHWGRNQYSGVGTRAQGFDMPAGFCRLEPGEAKQWLTPLWPSLKQYRDAHPDAAVTVRAAVQLGTGRWCRSPSRNCWTVPAGAQDFEQAARAQQPAP
jgi:hypothetical protein